MHKGIVTRLLKLRPRVLLVGGEYMRAVQTHKEQDHGRVSPALLRLEEHVLVPVALGTLPVGPGQRRVGPDVLHHTGCLTDIRDQLVTVHQRAGGLLDVRARTALEQQPPRVLVLAGVQHIVAIAAEPECRHRREVVALWFAWDLQQFTKQTVYFALYNTVLASDVGNWAQISRRKRDATSCNAISPHPHTALYTQQPTHHSHFQFVLRFVAFSDKRQRWTCGFGTYYREVQCTWTYFWLGRGQICVQTTVSPPYTLPQPCYPLPDALPPELPVP